MYSAGFLMHLIWRFHCQSEVRSHCIIILHSFLDQLSEIFKRFAAMNQEFLFENAVHPLGQSILIAIISIGHRRGDVVVLQYRLIKPGTILQPPVGMMDQGMCRNPVAHRLFQGLDHVGCFHFMTENISHDFTREGIGDQRQVMDPLICFDIGDVADKHLLRANGLTLGQQAGMLSHPVPTVGCPGEILAGPNQQAMLSEPVKQAIPSQLDPKTTQIIGQQIIELARTEPGHFLA